MNDNITPIRPEGEMRVSLPLSVLENFCKALQTAENPEAAPFVCGTVWGGLKAIIERAKQLRDEL